jgi:hypothetical protein
MSVQLTINGITGTSPFDVYLCQPNGSGCFYVDTITTLPYGFSIPQPYDTSLAYMLKIIDQQNCIISGVTYVS